MKMFESAKTGTLNTRLNCVLLHLLLTSTTTDNECSDPLILVVTLMCMQV